MLFRHQTQNCSKKKTYVTIWPFLQNTTLNTFQFISNVKQSERLADLHNSSFLVLFLEVSIVPKDIKVNRNLIEEKLNLIKINPPIQNLNYNSLSPSLKKGPSIYDIRFQGGGVGFQKSESPYIKKPLIQEENRRQGGGGLKMTPKNRISFMDGPLAECTILIRFERDYFSLLQG